MVEYSWKSWFDDVKVGNKPENLTGFLGHASGDILFATLSWFFFFTNYTVNR